MESTAVVVAGKVKSSTLDPSEFGAVTMAPAGLIFVAMMAAAAAILAGAVRSPTWSV